jgi:hypothetical protein
MVVQKFKMSLINVLRVSTSNVVVFLTNHDYQAMNNTGTNITYLLLKTISNIGSLNAIQVIINNASIYKVVGSIIEQLHPHIFWYGCLVHTLNLLIYGTVEHKEIELINTL